MRPQFPCNVTGYDASRVVFDCRQRHLRGVPPGITSNVTELDLSENFLDHIPAKSFSTLLNLTKLNLSWANKNRRVNFDKDVFKNLTKLKELRLSGNHLHEIPSELPHSLANFELNHNKIISVTKQNFTNLRNMTQLWLSKNCYSWNPCGTSVKIADGSFEGLTKLKRLDLSFNNLTQVPKGLPSSLTSLDLGSNQIQNIYENDFQRVQHLKILKLEGNCPRCNNAPYPCVPCQNISLGIHPKAFYNLTKLETLNLGGNSLKHLNASWFKNLTKLKELFLSFNFLLKPITEEASFLHNLKKLEKLDISFNYGIKYYPTTLNLSKNFSKLISLKTLHLEGLVFQNIGPDTLSPLYNLKKLSVLNLGTNFIIHADPRVAKNLSHLKLVYLAENRLYPAPGKNQHLSNEDRLKQSSEHSIPPPFAMYPKDVEYELSHRLVKQECFNSGQVLILSSNNLFFIAPNHFRGFESIACLNLSGNGFSAAPNGTEFSLLKNLTYLDLSFNKIDLAYDFAFNELKKLQVLDLSHNSHYFKAFGITHNLKFLMNLPVLRVLNMSYNSIATLTTKQMCSNSLAELRYTHNRLGAVWKDKDASYHRLFTNLINLTILDISNNNIAKIPGGVYENLPRNLTVLHISHNSLNDFEWGKLTFFYQLKKLDLSFNSLTNVTGVTDLNVSYTLSFLDLSHNHIFHLDARFLNGAKYLQGLSLSNNKLTVINQSSFQSISVISTLYLHRNPFQCTCDLFNFILWIENTNVKIPRLTTEVTCDAPQNQKGHPLIYFDIKQCVDDSLAFSLYMFTNAFLIVFMLVTTVAHLFYWDASYVIHYIKAKLKGYSSFSSQDSVYDLFVTYDTRDPHVSEWVMTNLRVKLEEEGEKHLPLCLEERDWTPGVPLVDNLTQSIRYSRKTLFVLTENYVKTGVFKLAMYLAHQRLLDENVDVIVLLMLEPVLQHSHFLRLRRRLCGKSIMEWPKTAAAQPWFWQNLINVVRVDNQVIYNKTYSKYFTNR